MLTSFKLARKTTHGLLGCYCALLGARAALTRAQGPSRWTSRLRCGAQPWRSPQLAGCTVAPADAVSPVHL